MMDNKELVLLASMEGSVDPEDVVAATGAMTEEEKAATRRNLDIPNANVIDDTLSIEGAAADAKAVGDALQAIRSGAEQDADQHLGFYIDADGYICQKISSDE